MQGWNNKAFHLGPDRLARLPRHEAYVAQVDKEQRWLPRLAAGLPLPIPAPVALGAPGEGYPWPWSVYRWIEGRSAADAGLSPGPAFAADLAGFLSALQAMDADDGPPPGAHNFQRGGNLAAYDAQTRQALAALDDRFDASRATGIWDAALASDWTGAPVWLHGDIAAGNLLVRDGRLCAVIDFGNVAAGDPACDLAVAWTLFTGAARDAFRQALPMDAGTWARGRGWALWKALILVSGVSKGHPRDIADAPRVLGEILAG